MSKSGFIFILWAESDPRIDLRYDTRVQSVNQEDDSAWVVTDKGETFSTVISKST